MQCQNYIPRCTERGFWAPELSTRAIRGSAHGKDAFVHMATGGGKVTLYVLVSLCISEVVGIIISPLIGNVYKRATLSSQEFKPNVNRKGAAPLVEKWQQRDSK